MINFFSTQCHKIVNYNMLDNEGNIKDEENHSFKEFAHEMLHLYLTVIPVISLIYQHARNTRLFKELKNASDMTVIAKEVKKSNRFSIGMTALLALEIFVTLKMMPLVTSMPPLSGKSIASICLPLGANFLATTIYGCYSIYKANKITE